MSVRKALPLEIIVVLLLIGVSLLALALLLPPELVILIAGVGAMALVYFSGVAYLLSRPEWIPPRFKNLPILFGVLFPLLVSGVLLYTYRAVLTPVAIVFALGLLFVFLYYWLVVPLALFQTFRRQSWTPDPQEWPSIVVIIPAYNEAGYIGRCMDSIYAAEYPGPCSLIVVDDGSTDGTYAEAVDHALPDTQVFRTENSGKHAALNMALEQTDAEYIVSVDADSHIHPDALTELIGRFFRYDDAGAVAGNVKVENRGSLITNLQALEYIMGINTFRRAFDLVGTVTVVPGSLGAFRREVLADVGGYSADTLTEDFDLTIEILKHGYSIRASEGIVYTEAPDTWRDLYVQRRRWFQGNLQTLIKHRDVFRDNTYGLLHRVALPYVFLSMSILPLLGLLILGLIVASIFTGVTGVLVQLALFFVLLQFLLAMLSIQIEGEDLGLAVLAPLTLFGYKQFLDIVLIRSVLALRKREQNVWLRPARIKQRQSVPRPTAETDRSRRDDGFLWGLAGSPELGERSQRDDGFLWGPPALARWKRRQADERGQEDGDIDAQAATSKARFEVYEDTAGEYRWRLVHQNGNIIADGGEGYASKSNAKQGVESVRTNAPGAQVIDHSKGEPDPDQGGSNATFELFIDSAGKWRWRLRHDNGNIIADSGQGYSSKQTAKQGLTSVQTNVSGAPVKAPE